TCAAISSSTTTTEAGWPTAQPVSLYGNAFRAAGAIGHCDLRKRDCLHRSVSDFKAAEGATADLELWVSLDGLRPPRRSWGCDGGASPESHLPRRRRKHPDERSGVPDHRSSPLTHQDLRSEQRGLSLDANDAVGLLRTTHRGGTRERRFISRHGQ